MFTEEELSYVKRHVKRMLENRPDYDLGDINELEEEYTITKASGTYEVTLGDNWFSIPRFFG